MNRVSRALSMIRSFFAALEQPRRLHLLRPRRECRSRTAPSQHLDTLEKWRISPERREFLEEQGEIALLSENVRRELFDPAEAVQKPGRGLGADSGNAGITVGGISHQREQVRNQRRIDAELFTYPGRIANRFAAAVDLHHARSAHALPEGLVPRPDNDFLYAVVLRRGL